MRRLISMLAALGLAAVSFGPATACQADEIPVTTTSTAAKMDFFAGQAALDPSSGTAFVKKGHVNSFLGNYAEARADYDQGVAVAKSANSAFLANYTMFTWVHAGESEEAVAARRGDTGTARKMAAANRKLVADRKNPRRLENYHDLMGLIALKTGNHEKAIEHYGKANPNNMYSKYHLALAYEGAGQADQARELFSEVANWNFNSIGYALVRKDAIAKSS